MDKTAAEKKVFNEIYLPAFKEKCASYGVKFETDEDVEDALNTVVLLKEAGIKSTKASQNTQPRVSIMKSAAIDLSKAVAQAQTQAQPTQPNAELVDALNCL